MHARFPDAVERSDSVVSVEVGYEAGVKAKLERLRTDLIDLAFVLETRGRLEAADVALATSARVGELCDELDGEPRGRGPAALVGNATGFRDLP
ncbi:MAG: hypothetical protein JNN01_01290 [Opitutaceae bacterium]|nr:hypothetical protein [Opitutaceae bacterium]